jgi:hypothetical protein
MKIYGLTPANFFAAIVMGLVISFVIITLCAPNDNDNHKDIKPIITIPTFQSQPTYYYGDTVDMAIMREMMMTMWYWMLPLGILSMIMGFIHVFIKKRDWEEFY